MRCVVCDLESWRRKFHRLNTDFAQCTNCGLIRMDPIPSVEQISAHYAKQFATGNYALLQTYDSDYEAIYRQFLRFIRKFSVGSHEQTLIGIGCFTGRFLDVAQRAGFITYGVEYQAEAARMANERHGGRVYCGAIESYSPPVGVTFDVVTAFGLLEHVTAPGITVRRVANLLKPGGIFAIQTPNTASLPARLLGRRWPPYAPIEHIYYFSRTNMGLLLKRYGLRILKFSSHWKRLPMGYVYRQFQSFGPEYYRLASKIMPFVPRRALAWKLPVYGGEMLLVAEKS